MVWKGESGSARIVILEVLVAVLPEEREEYVATSTVSAGLGKTDSKRSPVE